MFVISPCLEKSAIDEMLSSICFANVSLVIFALREFFNMSCEVIEISNFLPFKIYKNMIKYEFNYKLKSILLVKCDNL